MFVLFFFFKQKTAYEMRISDWSSDVCSSDLFQGFASWPHRLLTVGCSLAGPANGKNAAAVKRWPCDPRKYPRRRRESPLGRVQLAGNVQKERPGGVQEVPR